MGLLKSSISISDTDRNCKLFVEPEQKRGCLNTTAPFHDGGEQGMRLGFADLPTSATDERISARADFLLRTSITD